MKNNEMKNMFLGELEEEAIDRIKRFYKIAKTMGFDMCVGFSGGKDSQSGSI